MSSPLANAIAELSSPEADARAQAARVIYESGRKRAIDATEEWSKDAELARLILGPKRETTVGVAVGRETFGKIRVANSVAGLAEVPSEQDAEEFELHFTDEIQLDILTSRAPGADGAIAKFLTKFGEGVQQVEFRCENVDRATEILREKFGVKAVYAETRPGAGGTKVNFFLVKSADGGMILIELYEAGPAQAK
ncbi:MAG TPA: hypothetical protein VJN93_09700 [Candidatus Acidoferrum sp.]|nr:hypothetical protein [Candidatus Acidoferrum sp.]